jgi:hypothetical protein
MMAKSSYSFVEKQLPGLSVALENGFSSWNLSAFGAYPCAVFPPVGLRRTVVRWLTFSAEHQMVALPTPF